MNFEQSKDYLLKRANELSVELDLLATESRNLALQSLKEKLVKTSISQQGGIGVRAIVEGKSGFAYTEEKSEEALNWVLNEAIENAKLQTKSESFLPQASDLGEHDLLADGLTAPIEDKVATVIGLEHNLLKEPKLKTIAAANYFESENSTTIASTNGLSGSYRNGYAGYFGNFVLQDGDSIKQAFDVEVRKSYKLLNPELGAQKMLQKGMRHLNAKELKSGKYTAYFEANAFSQFLALLQFMLNGKSLVEGMSLLAKKLDQKVASEIVTIVDNPFLEDGLASRPFDSEGTPAKEIELIKSGVLKSFMHNSATAKATGQANTGHATRSYKSSLGVGATNFYLKPGSGISLKDGILVTDVMGAHAGINHISGDFSIQALGILIEDSKEKHAVENFAISGNIIEMLKNISAIGTELEWTILAGIIGTPMVEVSELSFAGSS